MAVEVQAVRSTHKPIAEAQARVSVNSILFCNCSGVLQAEVPAVKKQSSYISQFLILRPSLLPGSHSPLFAYRAHPLCRQLTKVHLSLSCQVIKIHKLVASPVYPAMYLPDKFVSSCAVLDTDVCLKDVTFGCPHLLSSNLPKKGELKCQPDSPFSSKNDIISQTFISQEYTFSTDKHLPGIMDSEICPFCITFYCLCKNNMLSPRTTTIHNYCFLQFLLRHGPVGDFQPSQFSSVQRLS